MIPVNEPVLSKNARTYINECLHSGWISSSGSFITRFEEDFARYLGVGFATTTTNGTAALHLAIAALNIGPGDEVIVPDLTIISCALAVVYTGATPVFVDVEAATGTIDPKKIEAKITKRTKAIMVVHLYGHPADMDPIMVIARKYRIPVIEDAAEAHGAQYKGKKCGSIGDVACFSFYANKIVTTGEGGMLVTNNKQLYEKAKLLKNLAHSPKRRFWHVSIGFNYRMTNLQAALGVAQLEKIDEYIRKKQWMAEEYNKRLGDIPSLELPRQMPWAKSVWWMYAVRAKDKKTVRQRLFEKGVDTRDFFYPLHRQPVLTRYASGSYPVSDDLSRRGFYLPSGLAISKKQIQFVSKAFHELFRHPSNV